MNEQQEKDWAELVEHSQSMLDSKCPLIEDELIVAANAEIERLRRYESAYNEWHEKTEWIQRSARADELGMHRADVMTKRIGELEQERDQLKAQNERLSEIFANEVEADHVFTEAELAAHDAELQAQAVEDALNGLCDKLRYEFEGPYGLSEVEEFIERYADQLRAKAKGEK